MNHHNLLSNDRRSNLGLQFGSHHFLGRTFFANLWKVSVRFFRQLKKNHPRRERVNYI